MATKPKTKPVKEKVEKELPEAAPASEVVEAPEADKPTKKVESVDSYDVTKGDQYIRSYSREVHGDAFKELAEGFVNKNNSKKNNGNWTLVPSHTIPIVEVRYREQEDFDVHPDKRKPDSPMVDKIKHFDDKEAALAFKIQKFGSTVVISKRKEMKKAK